jgi:hypothetical protein
MINKTTLTFFSILISLLYAYGDYYGYFRYFILKYNMFNSNKKLIENYSKLESADSCRVVVSILTYSNRLQSIDAVIRSLLDQTVKVSEICLLVIRSENDDTAPSLLIEQCCQIYYASKATEFNEDFHKYRTVLREREADTKIILLNDNMIYGKDFIEEMCKKCDCGYECVVDNNLFVLKPDYIYDKNMDRMTIVPKYENYTENYKL